MFGPLSQKKKKIRKQLHMAKRCLQGCICVRWQGQDLISHWPIWSIRDDLYAVTKAEVELRVLAVSHQEDLVRCVLIHFQYRAPANLTFANLADFFFRKAHTQHMPLPRHTETSNPLYFSTFHRQPSASTKSPLSNRCQLLTAFPLPTLTLRPLLTIHFSWKVFFTLRLFLSILYNVLITALTMLFPPSL